MGALLFVLLLTSAPTAAHTSGGPGHGHLYITLGDDSRTPGGEPADRLSYGFEGTLVVQEDANGTRFLRMSLPPEAALQEFTAGSVDDDDTRTRIVDDEAGRHALLEWTQEAPEPGTEIEAVQLSATDQADTRASFPLRWPGLGAFDDLAVRVEIPSDLTLANSGLIKQIAGHTPAGRDVWTTIDLDEPEFEATVQPVYTGGDPALAHPPSPVWAWLILLGIVLISGGAWALGKRIEAKRTDETE